MQHTNRSDLGGTYVQLTGYETLIRCLLLYALELENVAGSQGS
jgi:hypothetical protein